jgi:release factor glutamine methyltransferase
VIKNLRRLAARLEGALPRSIPRHERVLGLDLWIPESVLPPAMFRTGPLLARAVIDRAPKNVLDLGTGSGIVSIAAAREGIAATALDLNPAAVRAAQVNAMLNQVVIDARESDLFSALSAQERFEIIAFNPPFFEGSSGGALRLALSDGPGLPTFDRFLGGARAHLETNGAILIAGSTNGALGRVRELYRAHGYRFFEGASKERLSERLVIDVLTC